MVLSCLFYYMNRPIDYAIGSAVCTDTLGCNRSKQSSTGEPYQAFTIRSNKALRDLESSTLVRSIFALTYEFRIIRSSLYTCGLNWRLQIRGPKWRRIIL
jgi:hypothetical protein